MINFFQIKNVRSYLTKEAKETEVLSRMISYLDYCNLILYGVSDKDIYKLQWIQNMFAKLVLKPRTFDSSKQALYHLHWLHIKARTNQNFYNIYVPEFCRQRTTLLDWTS